MRKYFQITVVVGAFFLLVWARSGRNQIGASNSASNNLGPLSASPTPSSTSTDTSATATPSPNSTPSTQSTPPTQTSPPAQSTPAPSTNSTGTYKNGTYTGNVADAYYGNMQVQVRISGGKITDIGFLQYPSDNRTSQRINSQALPILKQEAITAQSASIDMVSGASASSPAFIQSLSDALSQAKA